MRYVVDANILFSALYDPESSAGRLLEQAISDELELYSTDHIRDEMLDILMRKLDYSAEDAVEAVRAMPVKWLEPGIYSDVMALARKHADGDADASILAASKVLSCDAVSGDKRLLASNMPGARVRRLRDVACGAG